MIVNCIEKFGVKLNRLTEDKIELVRRWRTDPKISQYMGFRGEITPEMQLQWFKRINNEFNHYFIIEVEGKEIGLINVKDVDYEKGVGEPGIFIWDDDYLNSDYSFRASMALQLFCFEDLKLKKLIVHILRTNKRAIQFNLFKGFKLSPNQEDLELQEYTLDRDTAAARRNKILKYLS